MGTSLYHECVESIVHRISCRTECGVRCAVLFGGMVRDGGGIAGWSDIDVIFILERMSRCGLEVFSKEIKSAESIYGIRIDAVYVLLSELEDRNISTNYCNGTVINALNLSRGVGTVLYGSMPDIKFTVEQERAAAISYIFNTRNMMREYIVNVILAGAGDKSYNVQRIFRWCFSIIRSGLRLYDVFCHPYDESIEWLRKIYPELNVNILVRAAETRRHFNEKIFTIDDIYEIYEYVENLSSLMISGYTLRMQSEN